MLAFQLAASVGQACTPSRSGVRAEHRRLDQRHCFLAQLECTPACPRLMSERPTVTPSFTLSVDQQNHNGLLTSCMNVINSHGTSSPVCDCSFPLVAPSDTDWNVRKETCTSSLWGLKQLITLASQCLAYCHSRYAEAQNVDLIRIRRAFQANAVQHVAGRGACVGISLFWASCFSLACDSLDTKRLSSSLAICELGTRKHCDPSFLPTAKLAPSTTREHWQMYKAASSGGYLCPSRGSQLCL